MTTPLKITDIKVGDKLIADDGFTCIEAGRVVEVYAEPDGGLAIKCCGADGEESDYGSSHGLDGQVDEHGIVVGFSRVAA